MDHHGSQHAVTGQDITDVTDALTDKKYDP